LPFAGYHFVTTLDFLQHEPIGGKPLFYYALEQEKALQRAEVGVIPKDIRGHRLWEQLNVVIILTEQFRFR